MTAATAISRQTAIEAPHAAVTNLAMFDALSDGDAADFVDRMLDAVIDRLRHDPRWQTLSRYDLDLILADVRQQFTNQLARLIDDRVSAREIVREFCYALDDETAGGDA
jgi:hypothetical protein